MAAKKGDKSTDIKNEDTLANFVDRNIIFVKCFHCSSPHTRYERVHVNVVSSGSVGALQSLNDVQVIYSL